MASFNVHLTVGLVASGLGATAALVSGVASQQAVLPLFLLGTLGSLLPDVDADNSMPVRIGFSVLSIVAAFLVMLRSTALFTSLLELVVVWVATYAFFRFLVFTLFTRMTVHRGVFHTVPAILLSGFLTAALAYRLFGIGAGDAWLAGGFVAFGYLIHLSLDELYSVNLFGAYTKRSFGTALKLASRTSVVATVYLYAATLLALWLAPSPVDSLDELARRGGWAVLTENALPQGRWFEPKMSLLPVAVAAGEGVRPSP